MSYGDDLFELNRRYYSDPSVVSDYASYTSLLDAEQVILDRVAGDRVAGDRVAGDRGAGDRGAGDRGAGDRGAGKTDGRKILDLGVGAGRTTPHLRPLAERYLALDYSAAMLAHCRQIHRGATLLLCDARRVALAAETFDLVFYAWNGIDEVDHEDRLRILAEIGRVLRPGGTFVFSTHNLDAEHVSAFAWPGTGRQGAAALAGYLRGIANRLRMRRREAHAPTHSIINDHACDFSLLTYYVSKQQQVRQLTESGFSDVEMFRPDGSPLTLDEDCTDPWIYYVARKPTRAAPPPRG